MTQGRQQPKFEVIRALGTEIIATRTDDRRKAELKMSKCHSICNTCQVTKTIVMSHGTHIYL